MQGVECDIVDSVDILEVGGPIHAMTFEGEVVFGIHGVEILNGNTAFDRPESISGRCLLLHVVEDGNATVLILERAFMAFELLRLVLERVYYHVTVCCAYNCHRVLNVGCVATLWQLELKNWIGLAEIPEFQRLIPAS